MQELPEMGWMIFEARSGILIDVNDHEFCHKISSFIEGTAFQPYSSLMNGVHFGSKNQLFVDIRKSVEAIKDISEKKKREIIRFFDRRAIEFIQKAERLPDAGYQTIHPHCFFIPIEGNRIACGFLIIAKETNPYAFSEYVAREFHK